ncbi:MAG: alpha-2-macroglobulin, partial [Flavobacteriales bacterium]
MDLYSSFRSILPLLTFLLVFSGCTEEPTPPERIDPAFRKYISAYTSDAISRSSPIRIRFLEPVEKESKRKALLKKELFTFHPSIKGKKEWEDPRTIAFIPEQALPSDREFHAAFELGKALDKVPKKLKTLEFGFRTIKQDLNVHLKGLELYSMDQLKTEMVKGILKTADVAADQEVEQALTAVQDQKELSVRWEHDVDGTTHHFTIDSVTRKKQADSVVVRWNGEPLGVGKEGRKVQPIPALGDFKIMSVDVKKEPDQHLLFRFSDPLKQKQDMSGIVRIENGTAIRTSIQGKELKAYPEEHLNGEKTVILSDAVKNILGHRMKSSFRQAVLFEDLKPKVELLGSGTILPNSKGLHLPFKAVNLSAVDLRLIKIYEGNIPQFFQVNQMNEDDELQRVGKVVHTEKIDLSEGDAVQDGQWISYHLDLGKILKEKGKGAIYRVEMGFPKRYSEYPCGGSSEGKEKERNLEREEKRKGLRSKEMGYGSGGYYEHDYDWEKKKDPCSESYYYGRRTVVSRNVFASNIGLTAKKGEKDRILCIANDLRSTEPIANAQIKVLDYQQRSIGQGKTNDKGKATIRIDGDPYLLVAEKEGEKAYLRVDASSALSTSKFDVDGHTLKEGLKGFTYTERGVHRPGDSIHLSFILDDREMPLPKDHPVKLEVSDPRNNTTHRMVRKHGEHGFYYFPFKTSKDAPTGNWNAKIEVGGATFSERLRVETIKPNRLKIDIDWDREILKSGSDGGTIASSWLHGASAKKLRTEVNATLSQKHGHFSEYSEYEFTDPTRDFHSSQQTVFEGRLDKEGETSFDSDFQVKPAAPGMLQAHFTTRVYERSGNASVDHQDKTYSPYNTYVGLKMPETRNRWGSLKGDRPHTFHLRAVDEKGEAKGRIPLNIKVYRIENDWWYDHSGQRDLGTYIQRSHREPVHSKRVNTDRHGKAKVSFDFKDIRWGYYLIRACHAQGDHCTGKTFTVSRYGRPPEGSGEDASILSVRMDKERYEVGETATMTMPSGGVGRILVSLENGSEILETHWLKARKDTTRYSFQVTKEMAPNIYAHATLIQPHAQDKNELPNRLFGITPVNVHDPKTKLNPELQMPSELAPETDFNLRVSEKNGKAMTYTVAIVDKGLLDLT